MPNELLADTAYGSDENVQHCAAQDIELVSPVNKRHEGNEEALLTSDWRFAQPSRAYRVRSAASRSPSQGTTHSDTTPQPASPKPFGRGNPRADWGSP